MRPSPATRSSFYQPIEADMVSDFAWGTANAQPVTLSFWAYFQPDRDVMAAQSNNADGTRSYPFTYLDPGREYMDEDRRHHSRRHWRNMGDERQRAGVSRLFRSWLRRDFRGPAGAWAAANYVGATGAVSVVGTNGATFNVTGVKLEIGSVATPYNRQSLAKSMADCQRYYQTGSMQASGWAGVTGQAIGAHMPFYQVAMRSTPTITPTWTIQTNATGNMTPQSASNYQVYGASTSFPIQTNVAGTFTASAEL